MTVTPATTPAVVRVALDVTGYEPASDAFYHGGDLAGLTGRCDPSDPSDDGLARIKRLGFTAVWITPPFVQRTVQGSSAAYHGYWFLDITRPDPHLGTEQEFAAFMSCAKRLGLKVFLDVVVNHTADVIAYPQGNAYVPIGRAPYRTAAGRAFNPWAYTAGTSFPKLSSGRSFAKTPTVPAQFRGAKGPAVLNEVTRYHNRGDIAWGSCVGRCEMDGDFYGLDDLMTEDWTVVKALADAYGEWVTTYGVDGFRLDTAKHVDPYFFGRWLPLVQQTAVAAGKPSFTSFGEIWYTDAARLSEMMLARQLPSVLDFPFQDAARAYVTGKSGGGTLAGLFGEDDYYTSPTTNAYGLTTFLGNHDMGRIGFFLSTQTQAEGRPLLERALLAHDLLYLTRGVPVVYYGDEVGMTGSGDGTDKNARQDMFPTQVAQWQREERIGSAPVGTGSSFAEDSALEARVAAAGRAARGASGARDGGHDHPVRRRPRVRGEPDRCELEERVPRRVQHGRHLPVGPRPDVHALVGVDPAAGRCPGDLLVHGSGAADHPGPVLGRAEGRRRAPAAGGAERVRPVGEGLRDRQVPADGHRPGQRPVVGHLPPAPARGSVERPGH